MECIVCGSTRQIHLKDHYTYTPVSLSDRHIMFDEDELISMEYECKDCGHTYDYLRRPRNLNKELLNNILEKFKRERLESETLENDL